MKPVVPPSSKAATSRPRERAADCFGQELSKTLGWGFPAERFAWAAVEFGGDDVQALATVRGQVDALREALPQQAVRDLVGAAPPGTRASELIGIRQRDFDPWAAVEQRGAEGLAGGATGAGVGGLVRVAASLFVWLRLYRQEVQDQVPRGRTQPVWWTLGRPIRPLAYHGAHPVFERVNASLGADWTLHDLRHSAAAPDVPAPQSGRPWPSVRRPRQGRAGWCVRYRPALSPCSAPVPSPPPAQLPELRRRGRDQRPHRPPVRRGTLPLQLRHRTPPSVRRPNHHSRPGGRCCGRRPARSCATRSPLDRQAILRRVGHQSDAEHHAGGTRAGGGSRRRPRRLRPLAPPRSGYPPEIRRGPGQHPGRSRSPSLTLTQGPHHVGIRTRRRNSRLLTTALWMAARRERAWPTGRPGSGESAAAPSHLRGLDDHYSPVS